MNPKHSRAAALALALAAVPAASASDWRWSVTPYAWGTDVGVDVDLAGREVVDETIAVTDLLEDIDLIFQGRVEAQKGQHGALLDVFYAGMSDDASGVALPGDAGEAAIDWKMDMTILDVAGFFDPKGDGGGLQFLYGVRVLDQRATVDAALTTASGDAQQPYETSDTLVDALAGVRFAMPLSRRLAVRTQLDVSTGGTDHTWSAFPSVAWAFAGGRRAVTAGYRHMTVDFDAAHGMDSKLTLSGPVLGLRMSF